MTRIGTGGGEQELIALLQLAYSGELAAAHAYHGHWKSVSSEEERERIHAIELEELQHRELVGNMLEELGAGPSAGRERVSLCIGRTLEFLCRLSGWYAPMWGAGKLESRNIREYETAARLARSCGRMEWVDCLLEMAEVEWEHERYFRGKVSGHWMSKFLRLWPEPPARESIRSSFHMETGHPKTELVAEASTGR